MALHFLLAPLIVTSALVAFDVTLTAHGEETTESTRVSYLEVEHRRPAMRPKHVVVAAARQVSSALRVVRADAPPAPSRPHARFVRRITPNVPRLHDANDPSGVPAVRPRALKGNSGAVVARDVAAEEQPAQPDAKSDVSPATAVAQPHHRQLRYLKSSRLRLMESKCRRAVGDKASKSR
ncbi:MAG: hypothetical protein IAI50_14250 [Candidatus Eremiobacteraeota bacterium]|nr:hypothetical protein [Candidatus Eremiobacteraeota bacterium]